MSDFPNVHPHPEWRRLLEALGPTLEIGHLYRYPELNEAAGIDIQTSAGRRQFNRFAREVLVRYSIHLENVQKEGYRAVQPVEQGQCATTRVKRAGRQMKRAQRIATHVQWDMLPANSISIHTDLLARISLLTKTVTEVLRPLRKIAAAVQTGALPHPLRIEGPKEDSRLDIPMQ